MRLSILFVVGRVLCLALAVLLAAGIGVKPARASTPPPTFPAAAAEPATVHVSTDTVYYFGNFSEPSTAAFNAAIAQIPRGQLHRMVISSVGGVTTDAREIATWVHAMGLVVEVEGICFSSCANYIFPAGQARNIRKDAFFGWHGNERGMALEAKKTGSMTRDELRKALPAEALQKPPKEVEGLVDQMLESLVVSMRDEANFYEKLGLKDDFAMCGLGSQALTKYPSLRDKLGWGFSIKDMNRFGMTHIRYLGQGPYERNSKYFRRYLGLLRAQDCLSGSK